jgi:hypothetical protein
MNYKATKLTRTGYTGLTFLRRAGTWESKEQSCCGVIEVSGV